MAGLLWGCEEAPGLPSLHSMPGSGCSPTYLSAQRSQRPVVPTLCRGGSPERRRGPPWAQVPPKPVLRPCLGVACQPLGSWRNWRGCLLVPHGLH